MGVLVVRVVFVGDSPSKKNISPTIPFVGASCFPRLIAWIKEINPDYYITLNSDNKESLDQVKQLWEAGFKIIALGDVAHKRLIDLDVECLYLPHPSGLNRKLNDKEFIRDLLVIAHGYVRGLNITLAVDTKGNTIEFDY
jgi:uracil-DNA glycosylase